MSETCIVCGEVTNAYCEINGHGRMCVSCAKATIWARPEVECGHCGNGWEPDESVPEPYWKCLHCGEEYGDKPDGFIEVGENGQTSS